MYVFQQVFLLLDDKLQSKGRLPACSLGLTKILEWTTFQSDRWK